MKKGLKTIFSEVSGQYELVNHVLTFGLDIIWRKKAAKEAAKADGSYWLDICCGTGEMIQNLDHIAGEEVKIVGADFCFPMLSKALEKPCVRKILFTLAEANSIPLPDATFDLVTISFATRNINPDREILSDYLKEFRRVLKPGGYFINLETSQPKLSFLRKLFHFYVKLIVKPIGLLFSGSKAGYSYLSFSIPRFYSPEELSLILRQAGFNQITFRSLLLGIAAIHTAIK